MALTDMAATTRVVTMVLTACTVWASTPVDTEAVTAWEALVPLVLLDLALS